MSDEVEDYLSHYGVKGMRWGVIRNKESSKSPEEISEEAKKKKAQKIRATAILGGVLAYEIGAMLYVDSLNTKSREQGQQVVQTMIKAKTRRGVTKITSM